VVVMAVILDTAKQDVGDEDADQEDSNSIINIKSFYDTTRPAQQKLLSDPIFNELLVPIHNSSKRASWDFYAMIKWKCNGGAPYCVAGKTKSSSGGSCSHQLCECDRQFVQCLADYPCPNTKAMCMSPWRYFQNLFMGLGTGMGMQSPRHNSIHPPPHRTKPRRPFKYPKPVFTKNRINVEFG